MKKTILEVYALAVCFVTVTCFVICLGIGAYSVIQIANPEFTMNTYQYEKFQSNDSFWDCNSGGNYCSDEDKKRQRPGEDELTKKRQSAFASAIKSEQRDGSQTIVKMLIIILIDIVVFYTHWAIARRARASAPA